MAPEGFRYATRTNGEVIIFHHGKIAKMMRDEHAQAFLKAIKDGGDEQSIMAEAVGNDGQCRRPTSGTGRRQVGARRRRGARPQGVPPQVRRISRWGARRRRYSSAQFERVR